MTSTMLLSRSITASSIIPFRSTEHSFRRSIRQSRFAFSLPYSTSHSTNSNPSTSIADETDPDLIQREKVLKREGIKSWVKAKGYLKHGENQRKPTLTIDELKENQWKVPKKKVAESETLTSEWEGEQMSKEQMESVKHFYHLGINGDLSKQLIKAFPHIQKPTLTQAMYFKAVIKKSDIILRSHTASGKSFAGLVSMLNMHRTLYQEVKEDMGKDSKKQRVRKIESIIVVPSRELALQYGNWASELIPKSMHGEMSSIIDVRYYTKDISAEEHMKQLYQSRPRILVITAKLLWLLMQDKDAERFLVRNMKTLLLDEVDYLFDLPGRFPSKKTAWQHSKHPPPAIGIMNKIMKVRQTNSSGEPILMSGLESDSPLNKIPQEVKDTAISGTKRLERKEKGGNQKDYQSATLRPLKLIAMSATANSVLRHYLGARTGWLRTGLRDPTTKVETGKWIDMTGLSQGVNKADELKDVRVLPFGTHTPIPIPKEIEHYCVVVDQMEDSLSDGEEYHPSNAWRNIGHVKYEVDKDFYSDTSVPANAPPPSKEYKEGLKTSMLTCLAYLFATHQVQKGMVVIPDTFSSNSVVTFLKEVGVPAQTLKEFQDRQSLQFNNVASSNKSSFDNDQPKPEDEFLLVAYKSSIRGLDIPGGISHTFILGMDSIGNPVTYTHIAGRVSRMGKHFSLEDQEKDVFKHLPSGSVIAILCGLSEEQCKHDARYAKLYGEGSEIAQKQYQLSSEERKMVSIYGHLSIGVKGVKKLKSKDLKEIVLNQESDEPDIDTSITTQAEANMNHSPSTPL